MNTQKSRWIFIVAGILMLLGLSNQASSEVLRVGWGVDPAALDPATQMGMREGSVISHMMETLITLDPKDLTMKPLLAKKWEVLDDKTYRFHLQENVTFHDGVPLDAEAVKYSLERFMSPETRSPRAFYLKMIDKIKVIDKYTLQISLIYPFSPFLKNLTYHGVAIVSPKAAKELGLKDFGNRPIGTGPFKFQEWKRGDQIILTSNEKYWGGKQPLKEIRFKVIPDESTRVIGLETGAIDITVGVPAHDADRLEARPGINLATVKSLRTVFIALNTKVKPFDDKRIRSAIYHATNVEAIIPALFGKFAGVPVGGVMNPVVLGGKKFPLKYDLNKARGLLAEAGFPKGFSAKLFTPSGRYPKDKEIATLFASQLEQVGIKVSIEVLEWATLMSKLTSRDYAGMVLLGWGNPTGDPDTFLWPTFHSSEQTSNKNLAHYSNTEVDKLLEKARSEINADARRDIYHRALDIIQEDHPLIPLYYPIDIFGLRDYVKGFVPSLTEIIVFKDVSIIK